MTRLVTFKAPNLPLGGEDYSRQYQDQFSNALRLYFNKLDDIVGALTGTRGGQYLNIPYGAFSDYLDQTTTANTATVMLFRTTDFANGVSVVSDTKLTVAQAGIYNLQWSAQFNNTDVQLHDVSVWLRQDGAGPGVDVTGSTGLISIPNSHGGLDGHTIAGWNYYVSLQAGDFVEIWWSTNNAAVSIQHIPAQVAPVRPSTASVIATLSFVSAL
jgi:hypothetical protein